MNHKQLSLLCLAFAFAATQAQATVLYKGASTTDINNPANWSTTQGQDTPAPILIGSSDSLRFDQHFAPNGGQKYTASLSGDLTVGSVRVDHSSPGTLFGNVVIDGKHTLTLTGTGDPGYTGSGIVLGGGQGGGLWINCNVALGAAQKWTTGRTLIVNGALDLGSHDLTVHSGDVSAGSTIFYGEISGTGKFAKTGSHSTSLHASNFSYTGPTTISGGLLAIASNSLVNSSSVTLSDTGKLGLLDMGTTPIKNLGSSSTGSQVGVFSKGSTGVRMLSVTQTTDGTYAGSFIEQKGNPLGLIKEGTATLTFNNQKTYTANTTVNAGVLDLTGGGGTGGTIRGTATVNTGGTLRLSTTDATGSGAGPDALTGINLAGGTLDNNTTSQQSLGNATINMTGGAITGIAGSTLDFSGAAASPSSLNTFASPTTSTISGTAISLHQSQGVTFTVEQGTTASGIDLDISSMITNRGPGADGPGTGPDYGANPLVKEGDGTMRISGTANNYTGNTDVNAGTLVVDGSTAASGLTTVAGGATLMGSGTVGATTVAGHPGPRQPGPRQRHREPRHRRPGLQ